MRFKIAFNGTEVTDVTELNLSLELSGGLDTRRPSALQLGIHRTVGGAEDAEVDQLCFGLLRGSTENAGVEVFKVEVDMLDDNLPRSVGKWVADEAFIEALSIDSRLNESASLRLNNAVFTKSAGPATAKVDVTQA
jgi:hypothetical protein